MNLNRSQYQEVFPVIYGELVGLGHIPGACAARSLGGTSPENCGALINVLEYEIKKAAAACESLGQLVVAVTDTFAQRNYFGCTQCPVTKAQRK